MNLRHCEQVTCNVTTDYEWEQVVVAISEQNRDWID
jgi:hypothetical protein